MKTVYIIGGTMGVGKTTVCRTLQKKLPNSVFLDGDWCWDAHPFQVTDETKEMVLQNITFLLNQFIKCSAYENIIFCWVLHRQSIIDRILSGLELQGCCVKSLSLVCNEADLRARLEKDVACGTRTEDVIERRVERIPFFETLNTVKVNTHGKTVLQVADEILLLK